VGDGLMSLPSLLALLLGLALTAYALLAGADFGAGILDLLAGRRAEERAAIETTIGPLWEANHVWLIFAITILFSAFPTAFSALGTALLAPLAVALLAIVLRGAALGLRSGVGPGPLGVGAGTPGVGARSSGVGAGTDPHLRLSRLFGAASTIAPFAFGLVAGGLAQASRLHPAPRGAVSTHAGAASTHAGAAATHAGAAATPAIPWTGPFALVVGAVAVCLCAQLAASLMAVRVARGRRFDLAERFRRQALGAGAGTLLLSAGALVVADAVAHPVFARLIGAAAPVVLVAIAGLVLSLVAGARRRYRVARAASLLGGGALVWGWFLAQSPHLVGPLLTIHTAAATPPALTAIAIACGAVLIAVIPAFFLLFSMSARPVQR
jgi:cytochrome d ubiquinol oxidase subunit II